MIYLAETLSIGAGFFPKTSGRSWYRVTLPLVAASIARQCSGGTLPLCIQFQTCA